MTPDLQDCELAHVQALFEISQVCYTALLADTQGWDGNGWGLKGQAEMKFPANSQEVGIHEFQLEGPWQLCTKAAPFASPPPKQNQDSHGGLGLEIWGNR